MASPVLGSVRRTGRRPSTTPRAEASLTPAVASFRPFVVGRCPPHSCFEGRSATPASRRVLSSVSCVRRGELPDLVWSGGRGSESRRVLLTGYRRCLWQSARSGSPLQPWSAAPSTVRFSGSACRGPGLAMVLRRVLVVAAVSWRRPRWFHGVPGPFTSRWSRARACRRRQVRFGKVKQFAEPLRPAFPCRSGLPRGL